MNDLTRVFNIDCMIGMKGFPDKYFDLAVCDVPYGINHAQKAGEMAGQQYGKAAAPKRNYQTKYWDSSIPDANYFTELFRVSKHQILWGGNYLTEHLPPSPAWIVWNKDNGDNGFSDCELAWSSFDCGLRMYKCTWNGMIQYNMKDKEQRIHPTQKPIKLYKWLLKNYAKPGDKILDTHLGSMSSRIAAFDMGFDFTGYEIDKDYFEAGCKRFEQHKAQLKLFV
jgi:site-specific DNA-methyltransferase (adenine-specific)